MKQHQGPTAKARMSELPPPEPITALVVVGRGEVLHLSPAKMKFTLGSAPPPETELTVTTPGAPPEPISRRHAYLFRSGHGLLVHDRSTNGTYIRDRKITKETEVHAGDSFRIASVELLALDEQLSTLREDLRFAIGLTDHSAVDDALTIAARGAHILLAGPRGCGQRQLAQRIHETSARRGNGFLDLPAEVIATSDLRAALSAGSLGTVFVDLLRPGNPSPAAGVRELFKSPHHVRVIVSAESGEQAFERLGEQCGRLDKIELPALARRRQDIVPLFDYLCAELPTDRRVAQLKPKHLAAIQAYGWPLNLDEMHEALPRLIALIEHEKERPSAKAAGVPHMTYVGWMKRLGLK